MTFVLVLVIDPVTLVNRNYTCNMFKLVHFVQFSALSVLSFKMSSPLHHIVLCCIRSSLMLFSFFFLIPISCKANGATKRKQEKKGREEGETTLVRKRTKVLGANCGYSTGSTDSFFDYSVYQYLYQYFAHAFWDL